MKITTYIVLFLFLTVSCRSSKTTYKKEARTEIDTVWKDRVEVDTIYLERIVQKTLPVFQEGVIEKPCDSLGRLMPFSFSFGSGANSGILSSKNGNLHYSFKMDSVRDVLEKEYRSRFVRDSLAIRKELRLEFESKEKTIKEVWPWWLYLIIVGFVGSVGINLAQRLKLI